MEFSCPASDCENIFPTFGAAIEHRIVNHPNENIARQIWGFDSCDRPSNLLKIGIKSPISCPCNLEIWWMTPKKTIGHLFYTASSFVHHFKAISEFKLELQSRNAQFGSKSTIFPPCDLANWRMTLINDRAPLLCYFKLCTSFRNHWWIQTGVTVRKRPIWVKFDDFFSRVTLTFDGWPWKTIGHLF